MANYPADQAKGLSESFSYIITPSNVAWYEFAKRVLNFRNRITKNKFGQLYDIAFSDIQAAFEAHAADAVLHGAPDTINYVGPITEVDFQLKNKFGGEYGNDFSPPSPWNVRQVERNDPWSDHVNLLAWMFHVVNYLNAAAWAINDHIADTITPYHAVATTALTLTGAPGTPQVTFPVPDGIVPSIGYGDGFSKYLCELERSEPAFVKVRLSTLMRDIALLCREIINKWNEHVMSAAAHGVEDPANVVKAITKI